MYSTVKRLRINGKRKHDRDIQADPGVSGELTLASCAGTYQLNIADRNDARLEPLLPVLFDAKLITMHSDKLLFRGIERSSDGAEFVQEWSVRLHSVA